MVQKKILEVLTIVEKMTAEKLGNDTSCEISCEDIIAESKIPAEKFDFDQICLYALNEYVTTTDRDGREVNIVLYKEISCDGKIMKATINEAARGYFRMLLRMNKE